MLTALLIMSFTVSIAQAAPAKPIQGERVALYCRGVLGAIQQGITADFEELEVQTSKGTRKIKVINRMTFDHPFKFAAGTIRSDFSNLGQGECGMLDKYFDQPNAYLYSSLPGDITIQFRRARTSTHPGPTIDLTVHNLITSVIPNCQVHFIQADRIGTLNSFMAQIPPSGKFGCAK